jgi:hypothetical protein
MAGVTGLAQSQGSWSRGCHIGVVDNRDCHNRLMGLSEGAEGG